MADWTVTLHPLAEPELHAMPADIRARFLHIAEKREALDALYLSLPRKAPAKAVPHKATANNRTRRRAP
jgi:hypothetical protein